ncbi:MAG: hypothetical protein UZ04_CHB001000073 [Chlorobi bacterium OLB4]|nr:MAG: hypothetical protein UZ04_CHB001000073 [Chlorobi bacterium OLB4]
MYAKVALNLPINKLFTYSIPEYLIGDVPPESVWL